jgi:hypothetical protein
MNKLLTTIIAATLAGFVISQAPPQGINYQAVAMDYSSAEIPGTDVSNQPIKEEAIKVRFSIIKDQIDGNVFYQEEHTTSTDENGLFNLIIGKGFQLSTNGFPDIDWGTGLHFLQVEIDFSGQFMNMGTQQLWSVPYALYTEEAGNGISNIVDNGDSTATFNFENGISYTTNNYSGTTGPQGPSGPAGPQGVQGVDGLSINWLGNFVTAPSSPNENDAYYNSADGISYIWDGSAWQIIAQDGTSGGGANTLNQAYNEGGLGAGRVITANNGAVEINNAGSNTTALLVNTNISNSIGIDALNSNTGVALRGEASNAANNFPAIQGESNSSNNTNSAILGQNTGAGYAVAGQIPSTATGGAAVFGNNLRTGGGSGVSGIGVNGVIGESTNSAGYGIYGANLSGTALSIGTYGIGFNGVYGQTTDPTNGWAGYFTADVGIDGSVFALGAGNFNLSDSRLKSNLIPIESALEKVIQLNGKHYTIQTKHKTPDGEVEFRERQEYGVIAQEVEALFPEMIEEKAFFINAGDENSYKAVNYTQLVPVLIEAIKELNTEVELLEDELNTVDELKAQILELREMIENME